MPSKKKKYNARFPPARIKKIMQMDEEVGKVAATVPVIISRALELFIESLIQQATKVTQTKHAKTLSSSHLKHIIESQERYHFLRELVANVPDHQAEEEGAAPAPTPTTSTAITTSTNHSQEEESSSSNAPGKRPRGRPRKVKEATPTPQRKERRKRKKESSSSESENSEDTEDADEGTDEESEPAAPTVAALPSFHMANSGPSSSATDPSPPPPATTTLSNPPPISQLLALSQDRDPPARDGLQSVEYGQALPHQEAPGSVPSESMVTTFQAAPAMVPMYQNVAGVAAPPLFAWPGPPGVLTGGFPSLPPHTAPFPSLQSPGFPGMLVPGLGFSSLPPSLMAFPGLPAVNFPAVSPLGPAFPAMSVAGAGLAAVTVAGSGLAAVPGKGPEATVATPNGAQGDDDYDT